LQEVNPLLSGSRLYAAGLAMQETHELDQAGIEVLGYGLPVNLKTGLCTLAQPGLQLEKLKGLKLSGPKWNWLTEKFSFQLAEFRCALISVIHRQGKVILLVNLHLHHGPTMDAKARRKLTELVEAGAVTPTQARWVSEDMEKADQRRKQELVKLMSFLKSHRGIYESAILAGDFNCDGEPLEVVRREGWVDVGRDRVGPSWDPAANQENHEMSAHLEPPIHYYGNPALREFIRQCTHRPTHLDHVFVSEDLADHVRDVKLVCHQLRDGLLGSDHFGLMVTLAE
jgi:endonuclease/exonuclease/phosphatase family metal-dependent hydrolase